MEISDACRSVFFVSRLLALAPYTVRRNNKGQLDIKRSVFFSIYSAFLCTVIVVLTYRGLILDANSEAPLRMKSATSKVVTALDVTVVVLAIMAGVCCGLFGQRATRELNQRLRKVDTTLNGCNNLNRDRWRALGMASASLVIIALLLGLDIWAWVRMTEEDHTEDHNVLWYAPFYSLYLILTGLHINFANTAYGLGRRYHRLNVLLTSSFLGEFKRNIVAKSFKPNTIMTISFKPAIDASIIKLNKETLPKEDVVNMKGLLLKTLADSHESLGKCVLLVSSSYGMAVLFVLISCLLHLVATSYFLFLQLFDKKYNAFLLVQVLWIIAHSSRLLMVVEPCHLTGRESHRTIQIVCEIERRVHEPILAEAVKKFWHQLLVSNAEFSASGLCRVNRTILTSFASAIATYLVILIQFQRSNG